MSYSYPVLQDFDRHYAVEVPLKKKTKISDVLVILFFLIPFVFFLALPFAMQYFEGIPRELFDYSMITMMALLFVGIPIVLIVSFVCKHLHLKRVCTTPVKGRFVSYEMHRSRNTNKYYYTYAPKYKIFINGRYEIRTIDKFTQSKEEADRTASDFLVNPDGYEMIFDKRKGRF